MFLAPQHYQQAERYHARQLERNVQWNHHYSWGHQCVRIDPDALANHRFVIRQLRSRFPDGTTIAVPEDITLPVLDLQADLQKNSAVRIYLAIPRWQANGTNTTDQVDELSARYLVANIETTDENGGGEGRTIQVRTPNVRLVTGSENHAGFDLLPVAQVRRSDRATAVPEIDPTYIPPILACDCWAPLHAGVLERLTDRLGKKAGVLAAQASNRGIDFDCRGPGERLLLEQLRTVGQAVTLLTVDVSAVGVHPLVVYRELARLAGQLSVFSTGLTLPEIPPYDHDNLGTCFNTVRAIIEQQLDAVVEPQYEQRWFTADGTTVRVDLDSAWLDAGYQVLVGVQSSLADDDVENILRGGRNLKLGAAARVEDLYLQGAAGVTLRRVDHPPRALPLDKGTTYFAIDRTSSLDEWRQVERSLNLAARLSEELVVDVLPDRKTVVIDAHGKSATLALSVVAVRNEPRATPHITPAVETAAPALV
jgi:type VI secretion system protein ImpJ